MGGTARTFGTRLIGRTIRACTVGMWRGRGRAAAGVAAVAASAAVAGLLVAIPQASAASSQPNPFDVSLVSVLPDGSGDFTSTQPGVTASEDGRYVAFVGTGGGRTGQLFIRDRQANTTTLVSKDAGGVAGAHPVDAAAISGNGEAVAFLTTASLLPSVPDDGTEHAYVADWPTGALHEVPVPQPASNQGEVVGDAGVSVSADGSTVAFVRVDDADSSPAVVVTDVAGTSPSVLPLEDSDNGYSFPQLSADGAEVAYLVDGANGPAVRVSKRTGETLYESDLLEPLGATVAPFSMSADGTRISFATYFADRPSLAIESVDGQTAGVMVPAPGFGSSTSGEPRLSGDGSVIGYVAPASPNEVVVGWPPDSQAGQLPVLAADGSDPDGDNTLGQLTQGGRGAVFSSAATNYGGATDGSVQVYYASAAEVAAPSWPAGAALNVDASSYFSVDLSWPAADGDLGAAEYVVSVDGTQVAAVDGLTTSYPVSGLAAGSTHTFGVRAVDFLRQQSGELTAPGTTQSTARTEVLDPISVLPDGHAAAESELNPSVSSSGRYVAFAAANSCNSSPYSGDGSLASQQQGSSSCYGGVEAFVRDREAGTTTLISHLPDAPTMAPEGGDVSDVAISGDGREIAFISDADGLVANDTNGTPDLFVADRATGVVHEVAVPDLGVPYARAPFGHGLSMDADGTHVAYVAEDTNGDDHVVVEDWRAGTGTVVPLASGVWEVNEPELSADGSRVAYVANADGSGGGTVVVVDLANPSAPVLSRAIGEPQYYYQGTTYGPRISMSSDGRFIAYPGPVGSSSEDLQVQDLNSLDTAPVIVQNPYAPACGGTSTSSCYDMGAPALSADGGAIVFDPMTPTGTHTLYRASPVDDTAAQFVELPDGTIDDDYPGDRTPAITADGTGMVFQSNNDALVQIASGSDIVYAHAPNAVAPAFPNGAALTIDNQTASQVRLNWPAATDDHVVIGYRVTQNGKTIADLDPTASSYTVAGLAAGQTYQFAVSGVDAALNVGTPVTATVDNSGGSQPPGQAPLVVDASMGGGHATLTWDASSNSGVTGYRVLRGEGDSGALTEIADVDGAGATTYTDSGLAASTTYRYEVRTLGSSGEQPYTVITKVTTPALGAASIAVNALLVDGAAAARLGSDLTVTVHGPANLTGTASIAYTRSDASTDSEQVALAQTAPDSGVYTGKFPLAEGVAAITAVSASLTDGAGQSVSADATGLPLAVSGALAITVNAPSAGSVDGSKLAVLSNALDTGAQQTVNGGQTVTLPLAAATDYGLTLTEPSTYAPAPNYPVAKQDAVAVAAGTTSTLTIDPVLPALLSVAVSPNVSTEVDVYDENGALVGTKNETDAAANGAFGPLPAGSKVTVDTTVLDESAKVTKHQSQTLTLVPGDNQLPVNLTALPTGTVSGHVTVNGAAASWGHVTATETVDGRPWTFSANIKNDGSYTLPVLAGDVTLNATASDSLPGSKTVTVPAGDTANGDLDLTGPHHYQIALGITTVEPDGTTATLPVDWRTAVHFGVQVSGPGYNSDIGPTIVVNGLPGDVYTMCANGAQAGLPRSCNSVTVGDVDAVTLSVTLAGAGRLTGTLLGADGQPFGGHWNAALYELVNGQRKTVDSALGSGSAMSIDVPKAGAYEVDVTADGGLRSQPVTATIANGGVVDVGQVPLGLDHNFGGSGNSVVAQSSEINPGQVAEFRATYAYGGSSVVPATIRLGIPAGTTLVPNSVTLNGAPVADPSVDGGFAEVTLPDLSSGDTGTLHYTVQTTSSTASGPLTAIVRMRYGTNGDALIGSATTNVVGVTLAAPSLITGLTAALTGHAPAGATVSVYDEFGQLVGTAVATDGGLWSANATLSDVGEGHVYTLQAVTSVGGATVRSDTQYVTHNSHAPVPTTLSLSQPDGRVVDFNPASGVARFPYVFVPGMGLNVSACFPSGTTVSSMSARIGPELGGSTAVGVLYGSASSAALTNNVAPRSNAMLINATNSATVDSAALVGGSGGNCYSAHLNPSVSQLGAVYLDYSANPAPFSASELTPPTAGGMAPQFAGYTNPSTVDNGDGTTTVGLDLPSYGGHLNATASGGAPVSYTPTSADLASAAASGVPLYALQSDAHLDGDNIDFSITALVPTSWLGASGQARPALALRPALGSITVQPIKLGGQIVGGGLALWGALHAGEPYQELSRLADELGQCGQPDLVRGDIDFLKGIADRIAALQAAKAVAFAVGFLGGLAFLGIGGPILGGALSLGMSALISHELKMARDEVNETLSVCHTLDDDPVADPDWVIDPSGYTYEAVTSNRLSGVTATLLKSDSPDGPFTVWDAAAYGQQNPLTTDAQGKYGWNVPFGYWKVAYSKPGYETAYSQVFQIPPPRFDVNIGLTRIAAPTVALTRATSGATSGVTVGFDDYMDVATVTGRIAVVDANGNPVSGSVQPVDAQTAPDGKQLAKTFRFTPDQPFADGAALTVNVDELVRDYAGHTLDTAFSQAVTAIAPTTPAPVSDVRAFATDAHTVRVEWTTPTDDGGSPLTGVHVTASNGASLDLAPDARSATIDSLTAQTDYTVTVAAVNAVGAGPAQSAIVTTPPLTTEEAFGGFHLPPTIDGGTTGQGSVSVPTVSSSDTTYTLTSDSSVASVPHSVTVAAGSASTEFDVTTTNPVVNTGVEITASNGGVTLTAPVTVKHVDVALQATASTSAVALSWPAASDPNVTGYRVMRAVGDGAFTALADVDASTTSYSDPTASAGTAYRYQVFAVLPNDNAQPWSAIADVTTPKPQPVATKLTVDPLRSLWELIQLARGRYRVTAHLTRADDGAGIPGQQVVIDSWAGQFCTATTDATGTARCPVPRPLISIVLFGQVHASYAGSADYLPSEYGSDTRPGRGNLRW